MSPPRGSDREVHGGDCRGRRLAAGDDRRHRPARAGRSPGDRRAGCSNARSAARPPSGDGGRCADRLLGSRIIAAAAQDETERSRKTIRQLTREKPSAQNNMPTAQIYRINTDNVFPYRIYGGQQDNSSVSIANRDIGGGHIGPTSWSSSAGGESAFLAFNPDSPAYVMGGSYQGTIELLDVKAKAATNIMAAPIEAPGRGCKGYEIPV